MINLILIIGFFVYIAMAIGLYYSTYKDINATTDVEERVQIRTKGRTKQITFAFIYYAIFFTIVVGWALSEGYELAYPSFIVNIVVSIISILFFSYNLPSGVTKGQVKQLWKKGEYVLLLRPFSNDKYVEPLYTSVYEEFPESVVVQLIERYIPCLAIGQPSEVTSAKGAERVYLDLENWKEEIMGLIRDAKSIVVYLAETDSCLWEIDQLQDQLDHIVFFSDNNLIYERVREKSTVISLPEVSLPAPFFIYYEQGVPIVSSFFPTQDGYRDAIDELSERLFL